MSTESTGTSWFGRTSPRTASICIRSSRKGRRLLAFAVVATILIAGCGDGDGEDEQARTDTAGAADVSQGQDADVAETSDPTGASDSDSGTSPGAADACALVPEAQLTAVASGELKNGQPTSAPYGSVCIFDPQDDVGSYVYVSFIDPGRAFYEDLQVQDPDGEAVSVGSEAMMWIGDMSSSIGVLADDALIHIEVTHGSPRPSSDEVRIALLGAAEAALGRL